ncbi:MAG TPA: Lrp/AsnC ligand binding domain-containing protein [Candidatus Cybelea sp.]|jgi:DNA-binding Lrp family transcriptional regulator
MPELQRRARDADRSCIAMVTAFILMNVERPRLRTVADDLLAIDGIAEVYSVAGPFDLIAIARLREHEELSDLVTERVAALEGILSTETLIAFRSFSKKDLGLLWDIGS